MVVVEVNSLERARAVRPHILVHSPVVQEPPTHLFSPTELDYLSSAARGLHETAIGEIRGLSSTSASNVLGGARERLDIHSITDLVRHAIETEQLDAQHLLPDGYDPRVLEALTLAERKIHMALGEGASTNEDIALFLGIEVRTVKNELTTVFSKIGAESRAQAAVIYLGVKAAKVREAMAGGKDTESVDVFGPFPDKPQIDPVLARREREAVRSFAGDEVEISGLIPPGYDLDVVSDLSRTEKKIMQLFVDSGGSYTDQDIANLLHRSVYTVHHHFHNILVKLKAFTRAEAGVFFLGAQQRGKA